MSSKGKHIPSALADAEVWLYISVVPAGLGVRTELGPRPSSLGMVICNKSAGGQDLSLPPRMKRQEGNSSKSGISRPSTGAPVWPSEMR